MSKEQLVVIGGGITGMACALYALRKGMPCTIVEIAPQLGGVLCGMKLGTGAVVDRFYHHIFPGDTALLSLLEEMGLGSELCWGSGQMGLSANGKLCALDAPQHLWLDALSLWKDRAALAWLAIKLWRSKDFAGYDEQTARAVVVKTCGTRAWEKIFLPILRAKFGSHAETISGAWIVNKVQQRIACRRFGGGERLGVLRSSFQVLVDVMAQEIQRLGGRTLCSARVERISVTSGEAAGVLVDGRFIPANKIVSTIPCPEFLRLIDSADRHYLSDSCRNSGSIPYVHSVCVTFTISKPCLPCYFLISAGNASPFCAAIEQSKILPASLTGGESLLYVGAYVDCLEGLFSEKDEFVVERAVEFLKNVSPGFERSAINTAVVHRHLNSQPVFAQNYLRRKPSMQTGIKGLFLVNTSQQFPESRTVESSIRLGRQFAENFVMQDDLFLQTGAVVYTSGQKVMS